MNNICAIATNKKNFVVFVQQFFGATMDEIAFYTINLQKGIDKTVSFSFYEGSSCGCGCGEGTPGNLARKKKA